MAAVLTYASLLEDLRSYLEAGWTEASDPTVFGQLPRLITLAERRCARELQILGQQTVVTSTMAAGQYVYRKPETWKATISINIGTGTGFSRRRTLFTRSYEYIREYWPDDSETDIPEFYADYDFDHWIVAPTPALAHPYEALIRAYPDFLGDELQTNWATEHAPELLLYGALLEAEPFLKNDGRVTTWQTFYDRAASAINGEDIQRTIDRSAVRSKA